MKKIILILILFLLGLSAFYFSKDYKLKNSKTISSKSRTSVILTDRSISPAASSAIITKSIFIPYWTFGKNTIDVQNYQNLIYFGIAANENGIDEKDLGYQKLDKFINQTDRNNKKYITVRMIDSKINSRVLENIEAQNKIINQSIELAKKYSFDGIVLDFEISALSFESVVKEINNFYKKFYNESQKNNLTFLITVYGDTFYRMRPYDISFLSKNSDKILIMAYDFHKSGGSPGPNFPLNGKEKYGYDFKTMTSDFLNKVSKDKITVVFGLFGYDWTVDDKNQSIKNASSLSANEIKNKFIKNCSFKNCAIKKDEESSETQITYSDANSSNHIVWFESIESVDKKINYLKQKGINSVGFWAYSYF